MKHIFTLTLTLFIAGAVYNTVEAQADVNDSLALVDFYNSTNGSSWAVKDNWLTANAVSTWYGITTVGNRVDRIDMPFNNLTGTLPLSISNLTQLTFLSLANNHIGGQIPADITTITNLQVIFLPFNSLTGTIPNNIGNLTQLNIFSLAGNQMSGTLPASITSLINLTDLDLSANKLKDTINSGIFNNMKLTQLSLNNNMFTGKIPDNIGNATGLTYLALSFNNLKGEIPLSITRLVNLGYCHLEKNSLTGEIPYNMGNLTNLVGLYLQHNSLKGSLPQSFKNLKKLYALDVSYNLLSQETNINFPEISTQRLNFTLNNNRFTFNGLEFVATKFPLAVYTPQANIIVHQNGNTLSVYAGGTLSKNTYQWFKIGGNSTTITGDSAFTPATSGMYYAKVTNAIATKLILYSDTVSITISNLIANNSLTAANAANTQLNQHLQVYPNPATDVVHVQLKGSANISVTNSNGKVLFNKNITKSGELNVKNYTAGTYYITNTTTRETQKVVVSH